VNSVKAGFQFGIEGYICKLVHSGTHKIQDLIKFGDHSLAMIV